VYVCTRLPLVFLLAQLTSFVVLDREDVPSASVRHRALCSFDQRPMFMHAAAMLPAVAPGCFVNGCWNLQGAQEEAAEALRCVSASVWIASCGQQNPRAFGLGLSYNPLGEQQHTPARTHEFGADTVVVADRSEHSIICNMHAPTCNGLHGANLHVSDKIGKHFDDPHKHE
jgi:hypothetical protein